jgi:hypothetical protein
MKNGRAWSVLHQMGVEIAGFAALIDFLQVLPLDFAPAQGLFDTEADPAIIRPGRTILFLTAFFEFPAADLGHIRLPLFCVITTSPATGPGDIKHAKQCGVKVIGRSNRQ